MSLRTNIRNIYKEYPSQFWVLTGTVFIDRIGGALLFPFFSLYITKRFNVGMTEVGILFLFFSIAAFFGSMVGGALTDRFGRKGVILFGLVVSGLSSILMGLVDELYLFYLVSTIAGLFAEAAGPAHNAMVADLLPEKKRADGFGILRITANLAIAIGPAIGGLLAAKSYMLLFVADAVTSIITAIIFARAIRETRPTTVKTREKETSLFNTFAGYVDVFKDSAFVAFMVVSILVVIVYAQMYSSLSVFLRDVHGVPEQGFGIIMSLNAGMVVVFQFFITRRISNLPPMLVMALGTLLYGIGFSMYGFVASFALFLIAMAIITVGEMVIIPVSNAIVARFAPEDMRGRYMSVMGISWMIPNATGPLLAGAIMDNGDPRWVWFGSGIIALVAVIGFIWLHNQVEKPAPATKYTMAE